MPKIAFFDTKEYDKPAFLRYGEEHGVAFKFFETKLTPDTAALADGFDGVCIFVNDTADKEVIDRLAAGGVKVMALRCSGYNNVDVQHAYGKIHVVHVPAYSPYAIAEHTMALLLTSIRRIHKAYNRTREHNFSLHELTGFELHGKTVGIVGTGRIGQAFAEICKGFGMKILAYDKFPAANSGLEYVELEKLFAESDIISLHCPLTEETRHLINADSIAVMKKGVVLLNTSRGALVDAVALLEGIKSRKIGAACMDVYEEEEEFFFEDYSGHIIDDDVLARLLSMPNVLVTSHQAFLTREALDTIAKVTVENIIQLDAHGGCENELCYRCGSTDTCKRHQINKCF